MQRLLAWQSGDEDGLQSQSSNPGECKIMKKKKTRDRVRDRGVNRDGGLIGMRGLIGIRGVNRDRGVNGDRVRAGDEHIIPFEKHPPRKKN